MQVVGRTLASFDGDVDPGLEQRRGRSSDVGSEAAAHALLRLVGEHPGQMGRLRAARVVGGFTVPFRDDDEAARLLPYEVELDWTLREVTRLVDALIAGHLMVQSPGPRPLLSLTRAGFRALEALDGLQDRASTAT
jgi:hypothetical protein